MLWLALLPAAAGAASEPQFPSIDDPGGCALQQITNAGSGEHHFQFEGLSHRDRRLSVGWSKGNAQGAYILDLATGERRDVPALNNSGVFSQDDSRILVANTLADGTTEIFEHELATGALTPVAPHPKHDFLATYAPGELGIVFNSYRTGKSDIYLAPRGGGEPIRLTDFDGYEAHAAFSPDGQSILFHRDLGEGNYDIYQIDFETRAVTPFLSGPGEQSYPSWSPDGRFVAYSSDQGEQAGKVDIYIADRHGKAISRVTQRPGYNAYPSWSRDGSQLYFTSVRGEDTGNVLRAEIDGAGHCRKVSASMAPAATTP